MQSNKLCSSAYPPLLDMLVCVCNWLYDLLLPAVATTV